MREFKYKTLTISTPWCHSPDHFLVEKIGGSILDATVARIMSHNEALIAQLGMAYKMEIGEMREEAIEVLGERLEDLRVSWQPAQLASVTKPWIAKGQSNSVYDKIAGAIH